MFNYRNSFGMFGRLLGMTENAGTGTIALTLEIFVFIVITHYIPTRINTVVADNFILSDGLP